MTSFVVDGMLGKVALWLRLLGYDTIYSPNNDDDLLLQIAQSDGRVLLTSDAQLHKRAEESHVSSLLLRGGVDEEIALLFRRFNIEPNIDPSKSRCSKCNGPLTEIGETEKERVRGLVFEQTYDHYDKFWLCTDCKSVYFQGGHWRNIRLYMDRIRSLMESHPA
jgi:uncharacterized protein with PIN domain